MSPFPRQLAWFTVSIFSAAAAAALILLAREGAPPLAELILFAILVVFTAHLPVGLPGGVSVSPGLLVCMAALVVFVSKGSLLGAAAVGSLSLVHVNDFRREPLGLDTVQRRVVVPFVSRGGGGVGADPSRRNRRDAVRGSRDGAFRGGVPRRRVRR